MNKQECHLWQILDTREMAGIESHVLELSQGLSDAGWSVTVVFLNDYGAHPLKSALDQASISWICLNGTFKDFWQATSKCRPTLIHTHGYKAGIFSRIVGMLRNIHIVSTYHAGEECFGKLALYNSIDQLTSRFSQPIAVSNEIAMKLSSKTIQIDNFVSIPSFKVRTKVKRVAFVGRLSHEKAPDLFLNIASCFPDLEFHVFGDGPMRNELHETAGENVVFHGQKKMSEYWDMIDIVCMPSRFEGLPMAALEAMARAIPVIASDVGGLPQLIEHQKNGWICAKNDIERFSNSLIEWRNLNHAERNEVSLNAYNKIKNRHSPLVIIPQIESIYKNCWTSNNECFQ